mmetsp:Transcript_30355/g.79603  ORF Transcript_30355/g.79603 Transcript_30355/m.79603 type:complete len:341 (+) Transcript_30355:488-1510(+)
MPTGPAHRSAKVAGRLRTCRQSQRWPQRVNTWRPALRWRPRPKWRRPRGTEAPWAEPPRRRRRQGGPAHRLVRPRWRRPRRLGTPCPALSGPVLRAVPLAPRLPLTSQTGTRRGAPAPALRAQLRPAPPTSCWGRLSSPRMRLQRPSRWTGTRCSSGPGACRGGWRAPFTTGAGLCAAVGAVAAARRTLARSGTTRRQMPKTGVARPPRPRSSAPGCRTCALEPSRRWRPPPPEARAATAWWTRRPRRGRPRSRANPARGLRGPLARAWARRGSRRWCRPGPFRRYPPPPGRQWARSLRARAALPPRRGWRAAQSRQRRVPAAWRAARRCPRRAAAWTAR